MKLFLVLALYIGLVLCTSILEQIIIADTLFSLEGPTLNVLHSYDQVLQHQGIDDRIRSQVYFKKALIEITLNKLNQAIKDLQIVVKLDPNHKTAISKLTQLYIERGVYDDIMSDEAKIQVLAINDSIEKAQILYLSQEYSACIQELDTVLETSPLNPDAVSLHLNSSYSLYKSDPETKIDGYPVNKVVMQDLAKMINIKPFNLDNYNLLIDLSLFTECDYTKSNKYVQSCLRIDNEYKPCREMAKFQAKFSSFLETLERYSILMGHYTIDTETSATTEEQDFDFQQINQLLFKDPLKVNKIEKKRLPRSVKTNYDYLLYKSQEYTGKFNTDITKLACESYIQIKDYAGGQAICKGINDTFLPKDIPEIDALLLLKNKFEQVKSILDKYNKNVQQTQLFQERFAKVDEFYRKQEQHRQQQQYQQQRQYQQQQQQQQRQYQQQQQQRQFQRPTSAPKNDYYKLLDIPKDADEKTIKKGYRAQTLKYHPDKCLGTKLTPEQCEAKMQDINSAYEVLSDQELRSRYDRGDDPNDHEQQHQQQQQPFRQHGTNFQFNFGNGGNPFGQQFFGGQGQGFKFGGDSNFGGFGQGTRAKVKKNRRRG